MGLQPLQVGLDIGARTLKAAWRVSRTGDRAEWRYETVVRQAPQRAETLQRELTALLKPLQRSRFGARLRLAAADSTVRRCSLRAADAARIPEALRQQLPTLLPFDVKQAEYRYTVRTPQRVEGGLECVLSLAACESQALQRDLDALWAVGWVPGVVVPTALAVAQAARALNLLPLEPTLMVDLGEGRTTMALLHGGEVVYARDVTLGTVHLIEALTSQVSVGGGALSLSPDQAGLLLQSVGLVPTAGQERAGQIPMATYLAMIQPVLEQLVNEMRRTMAYGAQVATAPAPARVLMSGDGARLPGADRWLASQLALPVTRLDCQAWFGADRPEAAVVCGLALASSATDLQPPRSRQRAMVVRGAGWLWRGLLALTIVVWGVTAQEQWRRRSLAHDVQALTARWEALQPVVTLKDALEQHRRVVQRLAVTESLPLEWFRRLARGFPHALRLRSLAIDGERRATMIGEAQAREQAPEAAIQSFTLWLDQSSLCREVQLQSTRRIQADGSVVEFTLTCRMS